MIIKDIRNQIIDLVKNNYFDEKVQIIDDLNIENADYGAYLYMNKELDLNYDNTLNFKISIINKDSDTVKKIETSIRNRLHKTIVSIKNSIDAIIITEDTNEDSFYINYKNHVLKELIFSATVVLKNQINYHNILKYHFTKNDYKYYMKVKEYISNYFISRGFTYYIPDPEENKSYFLIDTLDQRNAFYRADILNIKYSDLDKYCLSELFLNNIDLESNEAIENSVKFSILAHKFNGFLNLNQFKVFRAIGI